MLAGTQKKRPYGEMQFVDQRRSQIRAYRGYSAAEADIAAAGCSGRLRQRCVYAFGDKEKISTTRHLEGRARVVRQHEDGRVVRRLVAPPALPVFVRPWPANGTKHIPSEYPRADPSEALLRNCVVDPRLAIVLAMHFSPHARGEEPLHQFGSAHPERILQILVGPGAVAVDGNGEALNSKFGHCLT